MSTVKPPPTPSPGDGKCLPFFAPYGRYCYFMYDGAEGFSWNDARHYCQSVRTELTSIHSRAEIEFIRNLNFTKKHNIWIGLTRDRNCELATKQKQQQWPFSLIESSTCKQLTCTYDMFCHLVGWGWTDKTSLGFVNWAQGEPNSAFHPGDIAEENCVEMYLDGHWNDNNCLQKRGFACRHRQCKEFLASFLWNFYFEFWFKVF